MAERDACAQLVVLLEQLARDERSPRRFLVAVGRRGAGIRPGAAGMADLATGGRNMIRGRGFRPTFDDGTDGQVRHFTGIAFATGVFGPRITRWLSEHVGRDAASSADGRLSEAGIDFADRLLGGRLAVAAAPAWVADNVCARWAAPTDSRPGEGGRR